jgi:hypothetical protein
MRWPRRGSTGALPGDAEVDAIVETARAEVLTALDRAVDTEAVLAAIYARQGLQAPAAQAASPEPSNQLAEVCDRIGLLESVLEVATPPGSGGLTVLNLMTARRVLFDLRSGLLARRLTRDEALRLLGSAEHNLREARRAGHAPPGPAADIAMRPRLAELRMLTRDLPPQLQAIRTAVVALFDSADDRSLIPAGR